MQMYVINGRASTLSPSAFYFLLSAEGFLTPVATFTFEYGRKRTKTRKVYKKVTTKQPLLLQNIYSIAFKIIHEIVENQAGFLFRDL